MLENVIGSLEEELGIVGLEHSYFLNCSPCRNCKENGADVCWRHQVPPYYRNYFLKYIKNNDSTIQVKLIPDIVRLCDFCYEFYKLSWDEMDVKIFHQLGADKSKPQWELLVNDVALSNIKKIAITLHSYSKEVPLKKKEYHIKEIKTFLKKDINEELTQEELIKLTQINVMVNNVNYIPKHEWVIVNWIEQQQKITKVNDPELHINSFIKKWIDNFQTVSNSKLEK